MKNKFKLWLCIVICFSVTSAGLLPVKADVEPFTISAPVTASGNSVSYEGKANAVLLKGGESSVKWNVNVQESGDYIIGIEYFADEGVTDLEVGLEINGKQALGNDETFFFKRIWEEKGEITKDSNGDEIGRSSEIKKVWCYDTFRKDGDMAFRLEQGANLIEIYSVKGDFAVSELKISKPKHAVEYSDYYASVKDKPVYSGDTIMIQAEAPYEKSDSMIVAKQDRTSPATVPTDPVVVRLNTIGGTSYQQLKQFVTYQVDIKQAGLYNIGLRYAQNFLTGLFTSRRIYIDGEVLFDELNRVEFDYDISWKRAEIGDDEPYLFYLSEGLHTIKLEVTMGNMEQPLDTVTDALKLLNETYRSIIMVTSTSPDLLNDYRLDKTIKNLIPNLEKISGLLGDAQQRIKDMTGYEGADAVLLMEIKHQVESFIKNPETIPERLTDFSDNLSSLGAWVLNIGNQPLQIDYIYLKSPEKRLEKEKDSFFDKLIFEVKAFFGSFLKDYNNIGTTDEAKEKITVWIGSGRDQAQILRKLITESFTPQTGIAVDLNLVQGTLVQATLATNPPDVVLSVGRSEPINLAIRGAVEDLSGFDGFEDITKNYREDAFVPYCFEDGCYAIPETENFFVMFYRKDIFEQLNIEPPQTWEDFYKIIPIIQRSSMNIGLPYTNMDAYSLVSASTGSQNIYTALLYQNQGSYFAEDLKKTMLDTPNALDAFKQWTSFYTKYDFPLYYDFYNRFRTGEMPLGIQLYTMYNLLDTGAPEIANLWDMALIPGVKKEDGSIDRAQGSAGTASIMLSNSDNKKAAFEFLKWWSDAETQTQYGLSLELNMGAAARYNPANLKAFNNMNWSKHESDLIMEQWSYVREIPEIPGGYYLSRNVDNAFKGVVLEGKNPRDQLYTWNLDINNEITRKRQEFNLD
ncbi:MAG: extracellular solute-binding protein [Acutalibacteraceae bacterium]